MYTKEIANPPIPETLYKYRGFSENHLSIVRKKQVYFSNVDSFNDPFDCRIPVRYDLLSEQEFDRQQVHLLFKMSNNPTAREDPRSKIIPANLTHEEAVIFYFNKVKGNEQFRQYSAIKDMTEFQLKHLRESITVFCLSEESDNVLLWSHYANNHEGFCIGFSREGLERDTLAGYGRIEYADYPTFKPSIQAGELRVPQVLCKSEKWHYEKEWRFIHWDRKPLFDITADSIREIILGCSISEENKNLMIDLIRNDKSLSHIKLLKAEIVPYSFTLSIKPI